MFECLRPAMKTLTLEELVEFAEYSGVPEQKIAASIRTIEAHVAALADECATVLHIEHAMTLLDDAGLCSSFVPKKNGDPCPKLLAMLDPGGDFLRI